jgi:hypothetical protein
MVHASKAGISAVLFVSWVFLALVFGLLIGVALLPRTETAHTQAVQQTSNSTYSLTLIVTVNNPWNSTVTQPRYWILTPQGLVSSANILLPAHTLIRLTIIDYDSPSPLPAQFAEVSGTLGNVVYFVNGTAASGTNITKDGAYVSEFNNETQVAHTFTIPQLGINIPSPANSVVVAEFYLNQTGVFLWHCMDPCGLDASGWSGSMDAPGWMTGNVTVYP